MKKSRGVVICIPGIDQSWMPSLSPRVVLLASKGLHHIETSKDATQNGLCTSVGNQAFAGNCKCNPLLRACTVLDLKADNIVCCTT